MTILPIKQYCRGAAHIPIPVPSVTVKEDTWYGHPSFVLLVMFLLVLSFFRITLTTRTILEPESQTIIMDVPMCKRIIHKHNGIINVSRENNQLLWIDISLPLRTNHAEL